ncbi:hypothetical protein TEA_018006 [Camellia sinensis var. sinensis]|uniref:F-box domain-containing protein n=1 Tax=Camellia sinensis var. sinensis TaxID=542762 RepID=A0A4S4EB29_CAMSN|nr:hypothetical protein TEA_018006 [Camellia sinensis var. sinensis]
MRYVCRQWYNIINDPLFIKEQFLCCTTGMFIQKTLSPYRAQFVGFGKMNVALTEVNVSFPNVGQATCDVLVLFMDEQDILHVANPLTKQSFIVPSFDCHHLYCLPYFLLVYARSTMECKVLCIDKPYGFSVEGLIYWDGCAFPCVVAWDVESEMFYEFPRPAVNNGEVFLCFVDVPGPYIAYYVKTRETFIFESYDKTWRSFRSDFAYSLLPLPSSFSTSSVGI